MEQLATGFLPNKAVEKTDKNQVFMNKRMKAAQVSKPGGNFEFSGLVTETLLLGNVATRLGQKFNWDRANLKVVNSDLAQKLVRPERRTRWEL